MDITLGDTICWYKLIHDICFNSKTNISAHTIQTVLYGDRVHSTWEKVEQTCQLILRETRNCPTRI